MTMKTVASIRNTTLLALALSGAGLALPAHAAKFGAYHIMPTQSYLDRTGQVLPTQLAVGDMKYYGGSVLGNAKVVSVIWGPNVQATTVAGIPGFTSAMVNSSYMDPLSQYDTFLNAQDGRQGTKQHIQRGSFVGQVQITPFNSGLNLSNDQVVRELKKQIRAGHLPPRDLDTLYMVYFPRNVTITLDGLQSCRDFGAYHFASNDLAMRKNNLFYSVEPDCNFSFNSITYIAAHEFVEAVTDNIPTPGSSPSFPQAWNRADGYEVADLCNGSGLLTAGAKTYTVTQYFLNTTGACSTGNYTSP
jgi:hypothetical protein